MKHRRLILLTGLSLLVCVAVVIAAASWAYADRASSILAKRARDKGQHVVDFRDVAGSDWDRVHIFGPYTSKQQIEQDLGFTWPGLGGSQIEMSDGVTLVVFVKDGRVVRAFDHPRVDGDFSSGTPPGGLKRDEALFRIVREGRWAPTLDRITPGDPTSQPASRAVN